MESLLRPPIGVRPPRRPGPRPREHARGVPAGAAARRHRARERRVAHRRRGAVLDHDGVVRGCGAAARSPAVDRGALPAHIPTLAELYAACGTDFELSLDVKDAGAAAGRSSPWPGAAGRRRAGRLWLCHPDWQQVAAWRALSADVHLVDSTRLRRMQGGPERRRRRPAPTPASTPSTSTTPTGPAASPRCSTASSAAAFGWDAQHERILADLLDDGHRRRLQRPRRPHGRRRRRRADLSARYSSPMSVSGQTRTKARPTMSDFGIGPKTRLSFELPRLSPITKYWSWRDLAGVLAGRSVSLPSGR